MGALLKLSQAIDWLNDRLGTIANWLVLAACLISAANAMSRYAFDLSSNAWLEIQWYLFAAVVMFGASHTLRVNERRSTLGQKAKLTKLAWHQAGDGIPASHVSLAATARRRCG